MRVPPPSSEFPLPSDLDGVWMFDQIHAPRPLTRLSQEIVMRGMGEGFCSALADIGCPFGLDYRSINEFAYFSFVANPSAPSSEHYRANVEALLPRLADRWEHEWLPEIMPGLERLRLTDFAAMRDAELLDAFQSMQRDLVNRWRVHGFLLFSYQAASMFDDFYCETFNPADVSEPYQFLQGYETKAHVAQRSLWELGRRIRACPKLRDLFAAKPDIAALHASPEGRDLLDALKSYLHEFGWRTDACIELAAPMWYEDPTPVMNILVGLASCEDSESPDERLQRVAERRENLLRSARARLGGDTVRLAIFEALWAASRHHVILDENHNFFIDQMGNSGMRVPALELGRRLTDCGATNERNDVFQLSVQEIADGLAGEDLRDLAANRHAELERCSRLVPPHTVGEPPIEEIDDPLILSCMKLDMPPPTQTNTVGIVRGTPASPGLARGTAKIALSLAEASTIRPGEILVCEMTLPPWSMLFSTAAAVVADTGGVLSHCATVAREFGIPCVVGTTVGTTTIRNGMELLVDGSNGEVLILEMRPA